MNVNCSFIEMYMYMMYIHMYGNMYGTYEIDVILKSCQNLFMNMMKGNLSSRQSTC